MAVNRFIVAFDSECNQCLGIIFEGDEAGYADPGTRRTIVAQRNPVNKTRRERAGVLWPIR